MKCTIPEISWHNRDPILTVDIQNSKTKNGYYRLATGGTDTHVLIWQLSILSNGGVSVEMLSDLTRHIKAVNAVRFSPNGQLLASSDDDAAIILWKRNENANDIFIDENEKDNKEHWNVFKMLRSHIEDIYDLSWSSCSQFLISGSVDNSAIVWEIQKGKNKAILKDHKGFVQGVAFDPKGQLVATLSSDRYLRIFNISSDKVKLLHRVHKAPLPTSSNSEEDKPKITRLFYDDTLKSFCRRLSFSPDGELLVAPAGILEGPEGKNTNGTHIFLRSCLNRPVMCFPTHDKYTIAVRFCPQLFELNKLKYCGGDDDDDPKNPPYTELFNLPYRMVFAVATQNSVLIYDTQQPIPFAKVSNIHYTRLSDVSWSSDGKILVVSSTDGYCSLISFTEDELGNPYRPCEEGTPMEMDSKNSNTENELNRVDDLTKSNADKNEKLPQNKTSKGKFATPIAVKRKHGKRVELITLSSKASENQKVVSNSTEKESVGRDKKDIAQTEENKSENESKILDQDKDSSIKSNNTESSVLETKAHTPKAPRRVSLITLSSPKGKKELNT